METSICAQSRAWFRILRAQKDQQICDVHTKLFLAPGVSLTGATWLLGPCLSCTVHHVMSIVVSNHNIILQVLNDIFFFGSCSFWEQKAGAIIMAPGRILKFKLLF